MAETNAAQHPLVVEFTKNLDLYEAFRVSTETLIRNLLRHQNVHAHAITSRIKDPRSLAEKIERKQGKYTALADITDLVGIRIIVHYGDEVDKVAAIINDQFGLDVENSIDKGKATEPDRFGYLSLHSIVEHLDSRHKLPEYERFKSMKCEIQIRTILQHAWAAVEHSLGYKSEVSIPDAVKRRFSRLAGLLELGDQEFMTIRNDISRYKDAVANAVKISGENTIAEEDISTDAVSLFSFMTSSSLVEEVDDEIRRALGGHNAGLESWFAEFTARACRYCGLYTLGEVEAALQQNRRQVAKYAIRIVASNPDPRYSSPGMGLSEGFSVSNLCQYLKARDGDISEFAQFYSAISNSSEPDPTENVGISQLHRQNIFVRAIKSAQEAQVFDAPDEIEV